LGQSSLFLRFLFYKQLKTNILKKFTGKISTAKSTVFGAKSPVFWGKMRQKTGKTARKRTTIALLDPFFARALGVQQSWNRDKSLRRTRSIPRPGAPVEPVRAFPGSRPA
jgi:hypothetical protein